MPFSTTTLLVSTTDGHNFVVEKEFFYLAKNGETITVPINTLSDGASIPKRFWNILPPFGAYWLPAVMHDYLYRHTSTPKPRCDELFYEAMLSNGVHPLTATIIYDAVRLGGSYAFTDDRLAEVAALPISISTPA